MSKCFFFFVCKYICIKDGFCNVVIVIDFLLGLRQNLKVENGELLDVMDVMVIGSDFLLFIIMEVYKIIIEYKLRNF